MRPMADRPESQAVAEAGLSLPVYSCLVTATSAPFVAMDPRVPSDDPAGGQFTGPSYPVYQWLLGWIRGRKPLAAIAIAL
jgi:hypothetical protein